MRIILRNPRRELDVRGPIRVHALLVQLDVNPESVLVLRGDTLATSDEVLDDTDVVELRPVISGGRVRVKCRRCREVAVIDVKRHNTAFCAECFLRHCREQVKRTVHDFRMLAPGERVLVAVSGGKDSLALWDVLLDLGYAADGLYLGLGIGEYSDESGRLAKAYAESRHAHLVVVDLPTDHGFDIPGGAQVAKRAPCGACGLSKRHLFNQAALDGGYAVMATGHNLDDEAAVLFGNTLRWDADYLGRQFPVLPAAPGFVRKVKPLVRVSERESAAYCVIRGIDYIVDECPMAAGNRHIRYKELLNDLEATAPGTKAAFVSNFFERGHPRFAAVAEEARDGLHPCSECGAPTPGDVCAFCRLRSAARRQRAEATAVAAPTRRSGEG